LHGLADTTVDHQQATELAAALQRVRVPHQILLLPGVGHTFNLDTWNQKPLPQDVRSPVREFLAKWLAAP